MRLRSASCRRSPPLESATAGDPEFGECSGRPSHSVAIARRALRTRAPNVSRRSALRDDGQPGAALSGHQVAGHCMLSGRAMQACRRQWGTLPQPKGPPIKALQFRQRRTQGPDSEDCCLTAFLVSIPDSWPAAKVKPGTGAQSLESCAARRASMSPKLLRPDHLSEGRHAGLLAASQRKRSIGNHSRAPSVTGLGPPIRSGHASLPGIAEAGLLWPAGGCRNTRRPT